MDGGGRSAGAAKGETTKQKQAKVQEASEECKKAVESTTVCTGRAAWAQGGAKPRLLTAPFPPAPHLSMAQHAGARLCETSHVVARASGGVPPAGRAWAQAGAAVGQGS